MYYTYMYLRYDGTPYYVGKGTGYRAYADHSNVKRPPKDRILIQEFPFEEDALNAEKFLIAYYGRLDLGTGCLRNYTDGGEGTLHPSPELRKKMSESHKGFVTPDSTKEKMRASHLGRIKSDKEMENIKSSQSSPEVRLKKSVSLKGKPWTSDRRAAHSPVPIVSFYKPYGNWRVRESITGKHLGYFETKEEAEKFSLSKAQQ